MKNTCWLAVCASAALFSAPAFSQSVPAAPNSRPGHPSVAYVYVATRPATATSSQIAGYAAAPDGRLRPLHGSPFQENDGALAVNGKYLFGVNQANPSIDSFAIEPNGSLRYTLSRDYNQYNPSGCGFAGWLFPDRTGASLYDEEFLGDCANNGYQSFSVGSAGSLDYLGYANGGAGSFDGVYLPLTFTGNDRFGYEATNNSCMYFGVWSYQRAKNGALTNINASVAMPAPPPGYRVYVPTMAAADPASHVAFALQAANPPGCSGNAPQLASFTADSKGNLTTTNTSANMPSTAVVNVTDLKVSPDGSLLAVAGSGGLQVFHFNGANPPTSYTPLLTRAPISQMFWDNSNHLYAISQASGKLYVFTVTAKQHRQAPGSPYDLEGPQSLAVQPLEARK